MITERFYQLTWSLFILVLFTHKMGYSQDFSKTWTSGYGVKFTKPSGFKMLNNDDRYSLEYFFYMTKKDDRRRNILPDFYLVNKDSSILILVEAYDYSPMEPNIFIRYWVDPNRSAFNCTMLYADTTTDQIRYYPASKRKYSKADWIAEFARDLGSNNTLGDFKYNRCLVINKNDQIFLQVTYLFKDSSRNKMKRLLHSTRHMFRFEDRPQALWVSIKAQLDKHYIQIDQDILSDSLATKWNKGKIYQNQYYFWGEHFAFKMDGIVVSVKFPTNDKWPYINHLYQERRDTTVNSAKWNAASYYYKRFLTLAKDIPYKYSLEEVQKLNADEAYLFGFSHDKDDLYRGIYQHCKVVLFHKRNLGSVILKYYYKPKDIERVDRLIESTWGQIAFKDKAFFDSLEGKIYPY